MNKPVTPRITTDPVVFIFANKSLQILLYKRTSAPELGAWAIPGGHVNPDQTLLDALQHTLQTKTGVDLKSMNYVEQLYAFDETGLDPRGHAITIAFLCVGKEPLVPDDSLAGEPTFFDVAVLPDLAFDHIAIVHKATQVLRDMAKHTTIAAKFMPKEFGISDLQAFYETVLGKQFDRRNFRKKVLALGVIEDTGKLQSSVSNRPGHLYRFTDNGVSELVTSLG